MTAATARKQFKVGLVTPTISHFEVPLYRLCASITDFDFAVFYLRPIRSPTRYDTEYQSEVHWGEDLVSGYPSVWCASSMHVLKEIVRWAPDVVILNGYLSQWALLLLVASRLQRFAVIHRGTLTYHRDPRRGLIGRLSRPLRPSLLRRFQAHHYGGSYSKKVLTDAAIPNAAMFFVPYSVDVNYFVRSADDLHMRAAARRFRDQLGWDEDTYVVLYIAQHNWFKGPDLAMEVFALLQADCPETRALIVGSGRMTEELKLKAARSLRPSTYHFTGFVASKETLACYLASDIVLFTSRYETWGRAINEAMLCQKVCVLNNRIPASGDLIEDGRNGFVVPDLRPESYVRVLKTYFGLREKEKIRMGEQARSKAMSFSYENHINELKASIQYAKSSRLSRHTAERCG